MARKRKSREVDADPSHDLAATLKGMGAQELFLRLFQSLSAEQRAAVQAATFGGTNNLHVREEDLEAEKSAKKARREVREGQMLHGASNLRDPAPCKNSTGHGKGDSVKETPSQKDAHGPVSDIDSEGEEPLPKISSSTRRKKEANVSTRCIPTALPLYPL